MPTQVKDDQATPHGTDAREFRAPLSPDVQYRRRSARWHAAVESALWLIAEFWPALILAAFVAILAFVGNQLAKKTTTAADRAHVAGTFMEWPRWPRLNAVRAVGGDAHVKFVSSARLEVEHGHLNCVTKTTRLPRGVSCHGAPRIISSAFDRPHRSLHTFSTTGTGANTLAAARAVGLVRLVERRSCQLVSTSSSRPHGHASHLMQRAVRTESNFRAGGLATCFIPNLSKGFHS